jgi:hypothetical protein
VYALYLLCFSFYTGPVGARVEAGARCEAVELRGLNDARVDAYLDDAQVRFDASELVLDTVAKVVWLALDDSST